MPRRANTVESCCFNEAEASLPRNTFKNSVWGLRAAMRFNEAEASLPRNT